MLLAATPALAWGGAIAVSGYGNAVYAGGIGGGSWFSSVPRGFVSVSNTNTAFSSSFSRSVSNPVQNNNQQITVNVNQQQQQQQNQTMPQQPPETCYYVCN